MEFNGASNIFLCTADLQAIFLELFKAIFGQTFLQISVMIVILVLKLVLIFPFPASFLCYAIGHCTILLANQNSKLNDIHCQTVSA